MAVRLTVKREQDAERRAALDRLLWNIAGKAEGGLGTTASVPNPAVSEGRGAAPASSGK